MAVSLAQLAAHRLGSAAAPIVLEFYHDYCCPFSRRSFERVTKELFPHYESEHPGLIQVVFRHQIQPWHPQSTLLHEAALAVAQVTESSTAFWAFSTALYAAQESFSDAATVDKSRRQVYAELAELAASSTGVEADKVLALLALQSGGTGVTPQLKYYIRLARQAAVHVSPTVVVNGLINNNVSSSWTLDDWKPLIESLRSQA